MIDFHTPTIDDRAWLHPLLYASGQPGAEYTFNNAFFWSGYYGGVAQVEGFALQACVRENKLVSFFPVGVGDAAPALSALLTEARERGLSLRLRGVTDAIRQELERLCPGRWTYTPYRDSFDYIYTVEELTQLHGKKLQAKRNHCNRFSADHPNWYTEPVTEANLHHCRALTARWYAEHGESHQLCMEKIALERAFTHFSQLDMDGMLLFDGQEPVAYALGVRMNERYYDVNFEKSFASIPGAYALINREFSRMVAEKYPAVQFLNREDDMGEPGLRRAKESYQPTLLLEKFTADWQEAL